jgi:thiol peroxidase
MATVTFKNDTICNLVGNEIKVGDMAPEVTVVNCNPMLQDEVIGGAQKCVQLVIVVPSLDTAVCDAETRRFNTAAAELKGVTSTVVSMDLPFAAAKFCSTAGIENLKVCSDFRNKDFANAYGMLLADGPLAGVTCRAIFVIDTDGEVCYKELVPEITSEPDYAQALTAARELVVTSLEPDNMGSCCGGGHCS